MPCAGMRSRARAYVPVEVDKAMQGTDGRDKLIAAGVEVDYRRTDDFTQYLKTQKVRFADVIKKGNIKIE